MSERVESRHHLPRPRPHHLRHHRHANPHLGGGGRQRHSRRVSCGRRRDPLQRRLSRRGKRGRTCSHPSASHRVVLYRGVSRQAVAAPFSFPMTVSDSCCGQGWSGLPERESCDARNRTLSAARLPWPRRCSARGSGAAPRAKEDSHAPEGASAGARRTPATPATRGDTRETPELLAHRACRAQRACVRCLCSG